MQKLKIQKSKVGKTEEKNPGRIMLLSKCDVCDEKPKFIKEQEACFLYSLYLPSITILVTYNN